MKLKYILLSIFLLFCFSIKAQNEFTTIWKPSNTGSLSTPSTSTQILFPGVGTNYKIYWEEVGYPAHNGTLNNVTTVLGVPLLIDFGTSYNPVANNATYTLKVSPENGSFHRICFYTTSTAVRGDIYKIIDVAQWGNIQWSSMENAFFYCEEMDVTATDIPLLSYLTNMSGIFAGCYKLVGNSSFSNWDVSHVTKMHQSFYFAKLFNQPISSWDISNVTDISLMFMAAGQFNQPVGNWDTSNVTNMQFTFSSASAFNQPLSSWNTSKVTNMNGLFFGTAVFNQPIGNWDTSNVKDMSYLFSDALMFNQPISNWDTSKVTNMRYMFHKTYKFDQPIENWDTSNVTDMSGLFSESKLFNQPIESWNTVKVTNMANMFSLSEKFNQPIGNWNTSIVAEMSYMFTHALVFNQPIGNWDTSNVTNMYGMFSDNTIFNQPIGNWDTSAVKDMRTMFKNATAFNQDLGTWNLYAVTQMNAMLDFSGLSCTNYNTTLQGWANSISSPNAMSLGASGLVYSTPQALSARNGLINFKNWTITNDTYNPECNMLSTSEVRKSNLSIYPNPVKNTLFFTENLSDIEIYTLEGRLLKNNLTGKQADVSALPKGIYLLKATDKAQNIIHKKFIKD
ncbi:BspA family leucine-rich repeat surface protein [Chryseobacterium sp. OSA05B]|uniref:BspA family leucine-rich repeat surface protein n=1 Tax=Chryseobacterium sp. OSA05B TaxID=2862650 RepID=UPI001CBF04A9|nr:BspA family leucine-rich repeat surface protein [Chryseobacterium sp. OSA05B]